MLKVLDILITIPICIFIGLLIISMAIGAVVIATIMLPVTFLKSIVHYFDGLWNGF